MYEQEHTDALGQLTARGLAGADFTFSMDYLPPQSYDGAMFTLRYSVEITCTSSGKQVTLVGGNGLDWVAQFDALILEGYFRQAD